MRNVARGSRFWLWTAPLTLGGAAAVVFAAGFVLALRGTLGEPLGEPPPPPRSAASAAMPGKEGLVRILVLGDSLARGTGDETGRGFAGDVLERMRKQGPAQLTNLGVNGMESPEVLALVQTPNVRSLAASASVILVSAGGNDLSHSATLERGSAATTQRGSAATMERGSTATMGRAGNTAASIADAVAAARGRYVENLRKILETLRQSNPNAPIGMLGLYDPFGNSSGASRLGASVVLQWNALAQETALSFPNVFVIPTFDLFLGRPDRLAADRYHPNAGAYEEIATRMLQVIGPAPAAGTSAAPSLNR